MAKLTSKKRNKLSKKTFALPEKRAYPLNDKSHARAALSMVAQHGTPEEKKKVRQKVAQKYPDLAKKKR